MLPSYDDILALTCAPPLWYDGNGVPRYAEFSPKMLGVYDAFAILARIACQGCRLRMLVGRGWMSSWLSADGARVVRPTLESLVADYRFGDPPSHGCLGESMTSVPLEIVQCWERTPGRAWDRVRTFDGRSVRPEWAEEWS